MALSRGCKTDEGAHIESLAVLAHELRNPLTVIGGAVDILDVCPNDLGSIKQSQVLIRQQLEWILRIVEDLQDMTRIATGKLEMRMQRVDLTGVVRQAMDGARPLILAGHHTLVLQAPTRPIYVSADPMRVTQVLSNLIENATKFCRMHGRIVVRVERGADDAILSVRDDGIGIDADALPHLFDLFTQSEPATAGSPRGLGIGLSLVKRIVEHHGGTVSARSDGPGSGSEFIVRIPAR